MVTRVNTTPVNSRSIPAVNLRFVALLRRQLDGIARLNAQEEIQRRVGFVGSGEIEGQLVGVLGIFELGGEEKVGQPIGRGFVGRLGVGGRLVQLGRRGQRTGDRSRSHYRGQLWLPRTRLN